MAHNPYPFTHDSHPDLTAAIRGVVSESHTRAQLEKLSITRLRELLKQYTAKPGSGRELADIRGLLRAKGAGSVVDESRTQAQPEGAKQLDEVVVPVGALMLLPVWIKQAIVIALVGGTALSYVLDKLHGLKLATLDKETREQTLAVHEWAKRKAERDGIKAAKAALLKGHKPSKGKKPQSKGTKPVSEAVSPCEKAALKRLRDANAADLEEYPGKKGEAAHKRLHKTIKSVVGEGVIGDTVQEDLQTDERERETTRKGKQLHRAVEKEREGTAAIAKARARQAAHAKTVDKEVKSKTVYGKGGKPVRKGSEQHKATAKKAAAKKTGTASRGDERQSSDRRGYSAADDFNAENQRRWDGYYRARADADHREGKYRY